MPDVSSEKIFDGWKNPTNRWFSVSHAVTIAGWGRYAVRRRESLAVLPKFKMIII
jgi:hypothetical protein